MPKSECSTEKKCARHNKKSSMHDKLKSDTRTPFVHKFETENNKYVYDLNTFRIIKVDSVIWDIVDDFGSITKDKIISKYRRYYSVDEIVSAYNTIMHMQKRLGLLLANRPIHIIMPLSEEQLKQKLSSERRSIILNVTEKCNFRCSYCSYSGKYPEQRPHTKRMMSWDIARLALDNYLSHNKNARGKWISFFGGEPLLNVSLIKKCVAYVKEEKDCHNIEFGLTTNGFLLKGDVADFLASENFSVYVSLDGPRQIHDKNRRLQNGSPTWNQVVRNLKTFLLKYPKYKTTGRLAILAVHTPSVNLFELEKYFNECEFLSDNIELQINAVSTRGTKYYGPLKSMVELKALHNSFLKNLKEGTINKNPKDAKLKTQTALFQGPLLHFYRRGYCKADRPFSSASFHSLPLCIPGIRRLFVTVDGDYYPCEQSLLTKHMKVGNVYEDINVSKVHHMLEKFTALSRDECKFCWCLPTCDAGCHVAVYENGKFSKIAKQQFCSSCRKVTHQTMVDMCEVLEQNPRAFDYSKSMDIERFQDIEQK